MTVRALVLRGGFGLERLAIETRPKPVPGAGEVRVRVGAAALNYRDLSMARGEYDPRLPLPALLGSDAAGTVDAVGEGVTRFGLGDRVMPIFASGWHDGPPTRTTPLLGLGGRVDGTFVEAFVARADDLVRVPVHLDEREASTLGTAGVPVFRALFGVTTVNAASTVLVIGTGGVSLFALLLARSAGARVVVVSRSPEKLERAMRLGATHGVDASRTPAWGREVRRLTENLGVDLVIEVGGTGTLGESLAATRAGGTIALIGSIAPLPTPLALVPAIMREIRIQGLLAGPRSAYEALVRHVEEVALRPIVDSVFSFDDHRAAFERLAGGKHFGKICLTP